MQISWKNVFLLAALLFALPLTGTPAQAAGLFGGTPAGDSVFVGEVQSYGDYELKADACATFVDKLAEALRRLSCEDEAASDDLKGICAWGLLAGGQPVEKGEPLFPRLG